MRNPRKLSNDESSVKIRARTFARSEHMCTGSEYSRNENGSVRQSESFVKRKIRDNEMRE